MRRPRSKLGIAPWRPLTQARVRSAPRGGYRHRPGNREGSKRGVAALRLTCEPRLGEQRLLKVDDQRSVERQGSPRGDGSRMSPRLGGQGRPAITGVTGRRFAQAGWRHEVPKDAVVAGSSVRQRRCVVFRSQKCFRSYDQARRGGLALSLITTSNAKSWSAVCERCLNPEPARVRGIRRP